MIYGQVKNGMFSNQRRLYDEFRKFEGQIVKVSVSKRKKKRTNPQNAYLWDVVYGTISEYTGYHPDELHYEVEDFLKLRTTVDDRGMNKVQKTSEMDTETFWKYVERVRQYAAQEMNLYIPDPE